MSSVTDNLAASLQQFPDRGRLLVAFSGGMDSSVLLHALFKLREQGDISDQLLAIHVNHGLQEQAQQWQQHCEQVCEQLEIPITVSRVMLSSVSGASGNLEQAARTARYKAFRSKLADNDILLLAHHLDDQMETLLLRLLRGSGARGLAAIPPYRPLGQGLLLRPFLQTPRASLHAYAERQQLQWVEDNSNLDTDFDRNYLRREVLPLIEARWPGYRSAWSKSRQLLVETAQLVDDLAKEDLESLHSYHPSIIKLNQLRQLNGPRQRNVLAFWLEQRGAESPGWFGLQRLVNEIVGGDNPTAMFEAENYRLLRYQDCLYALRRVEDIDGSQELEWPIATVHALLLPGNGSLQTTSATGRGIRLDGKPLHVRYRQGGEYCELDRRPGKSLKKILQESGMPPWMRQRLPLVYSGDQLVCVPGIGIASGHGAEGDEPGCVVHWEQPNLFL